MKTFSLRFGAGAARVLCALLFLCAAKTSLCAEESVTLWNDGLWSDLSCGEAVWDGTPPDAPDAPVPVQLEVRLGHSFWLIMESGSWFPLTMNLRECARTEGEEVCETSQDENGGTLNRIRKYRISYYATILEGTIPVTASEFPPESRYWVCDADTGEWSGTYYTVTGFCGSIGFGTLEPELSAKVFPGDLYVLRKAKVTGDMAVKGVLRVQPRGGLSMGEFQNGPRP